MRSCLTFLLWLAVAFPAFADLSVGKPEWGFDGKVIRNSFNILTFTVRNTGAQAFEGNLTLENPGGVGGREVAPYVQPIYLAPGAARTVQFYPHIAGIREDYRISWKDQQDRGVTVDAPDQGPPAVVMLADLEAGGARTLRMPAFHEGNFPPTAAATDGLRAVVLDHQPRWDPARREAFLHWVKRGGVVHLIAGPEGTTPQFSEEMAVLNVPGDRGSVGAGLVAKHAISRAEITPEFLGRAGFATVEAPKSDQGYRYDSGDQGLFRAMGEASKPDIAWGVIYGLTFAYIALIGPVFYFQRRRDYRWLLGAFAGTVVLFAWIFTVVGRRGYGEKQVYHSMALARSIEGGKWDVRQWVYPFATSGDEYRFTFGSGTHLYAARGNGDAVRGEVVQGKDGYFSADIPLFSSRPFLHHGVMAGPMLDWKIEEFEMSSQSAGKQSVVKKARIKLANPNQTEVRSLIAQVGNSFFLLSLSQGVWEAINMSGTNASRVFPENDTTYDEVGRRMTNRAHNAPRMLASIITGDPDSSIVGLGRPLDSGKVRLFAYTNGGGVFPLVSKDFQPGIQDVLFVQELSIEPLKP